MDPDLEPDLESDSELEDAPAPAPELEAEEVDPRGVGDYFLEAREQMFLGEVEAAREEFARIVDTLDAPLSTRRWAAFNSGLCHLLKGRVEDAQKSFAVITRYPDTEPGEWGESLDTFFQFLGQEMIGETVPDPLLKAEFARDTPESLGLVALGLKAWQMGAWETAMGFFDAFELTERGEDLAWVDSYRQILRAFRADYELVAGAELLRRDLDGEEIISVRVRLEAIARDLQTTGKASVAIAKKLEWLSAYEKQFVKSEEQLEEQSQDLSDETDEEFGLSEQDAEDRRVPTVIDKAELIELQSILGALDAEDAQQGYRFGAATEDLEQALVHFESAAIKEAAGYHLYLWKSAEAFVAQLLEDLNSELYKKVLEVPDQAGEEGVDQAGEEAVPLGLRGEIIEANRESLTLKLEFGEGRIAFGEIPPEKLLQIAMRIANLTRDSNQHYRRRELLVAFAHLTLPEASETYAQELMQENRAFRERWIRVMLSTAR